MATIATPPNKPSSAFRRAVRWLTTPFRALWWRFYFAPRSLQLTLLFLLLVGCSAGAVSAYYFYGRRSVAMESTRGWREYEIARLEGNIEGMKAGLDRALAAHPGDLIAVRKRHDLEVEEADPDDTELAIVLVNHHMKANHLPEMYREACKVRNRFPKDWRSICVQAHYDWHERGSAAAVERLQQLPSPDDPQARIDVGGLLYSLQLFENMGQDASALRGLIIRRLLPILRGPGAAQASPAVKINLVECYLEPFSDRENHEVLGNYWSDAAKLSDMALDAAVDAADIPLLVRIGKLGPRMFNALQGLKTRQNVQLNDARFKLLHDEIEHRTRRAWEAVVERQPERIDGHLGLIDLAWGTGNVAAIKQAIEDGIRACGDRTELLNQLVILAVRVNQADVVVNMIWSAALKNPNDVGKWLLAAQIALAVKSYDRALEACQKARALDPNNIAAALLMADWELERGYPEKALGIVGDTPFQDRLLKDPEFIRRRARALAAMQSLSTEDYLKEVESLALAEKRAPQPVVLAALEGMAQAPPRPERDAMIANRAHELAMRAPNSPQAVQSLFLAARSLERRCEYLTPPWQREAVGAALQEFDFLPAPVKLSNPVRLMMAKLQLKGLADPSLAATTAGPVLEDRFNPGYSPADLEVIGLILLANRRVDDALKVLEHAVVRPNAPAACWIALARARHAAGRYDDARAALDVPHQKPLVLSPREEFEWREASRTLSQESP